MDEYQAVYVVSDLHLGGHTAGPVGERKPAGARGGGAAPRPARGPLDLRIFREAAALAWAVDEIAQRHAGAAGGRAALVLNGDIVDFLAAPAARAFDPEGARAELERLTNDPAQRPAWQALRRFVAAGAGELVLVIGNHDLELAMHDTGEYLLHYLTGGDRSLGERVVVCYDGRGFECAVGGRRLLAVHGNAVDPWNDVDYALLGAYATARRLGTRRPELRPNAGTTLVVEHLNAVKRDYQWVDLLKPEQDGAAMVAAALDEARRPPIGLMLENVFTRGAAMRQAAFVSEAPGAARPPASPPAARPLAGPPTAHPPASPTAAGPGAARPAVGDLDAALREARANDAAGVRALDLVDRDAGRDRMLSASAVLPGLFKLKMGASLRDVLRERLPHDHSFDPLAEDEAFHALDDRTDPGVDFLIAGHTHLERSLKRRRGPGYYFNSGTWVRLVEIPPPLLTSDAAFAPALAALEEGTLAALERPLALPGGGAAPLAKSVRTVVTVRALEGGGAQGALWHVEGDEGSFSLVEALPSRRTLQPAGRLPCASAPLHSRSFATGRRTTSSSRRSRPTSR